MRGTVTSYPVLQPTRSPLVLDLERHRHGCICFTLPCHLVHDVLPCFSVHSHPSCLSYRCHASCLYILSYAVHPSFGRSTLWSFAFQSGLQEEFGVSFLWHSFDVSKKPHPFWVTLSMTLYLMPSDWRIFVFLILSRRDTPMIFLRHIISKTRSLFSSSFFRVQVSAP